MSKPKIYDVIATGTTEPRDIRDRFSDVINVKDFGAVGDGVTDDTAAIQAAFTAASGKTLIIPGGTYNFSSHLVGPSDSVLICSDNAKFSPNWSPVGTDRAIPLIKFGNGCYINTLRIDLKSGINTIRICVELGGNTRLGSFRAEAVDLNNNRTESGSTDNISGALVIRGDNVFVGETNIKRFDVCLCVADSNTVNIGHVRHIETVQGFYATNSRNIHVFSGNTRGPIDPTEPNDFVNGRGVMTPGANSLLLTGVADSSFSNWSAFDILEHGVRVGARDVSSDVPNTRLTFSNLKIFRPYGCGLKIDDGVYENNTISINGLYTEDVGHDNWFGSAGYTNWQNGYDDPSINNDGNKVALAIRNVESVQVSNFMNRTNLYPNSGYYGFWAQRSDQVNASMIDTLGARMSGVVVQAGTGKDINNITLCGVSSKYNGEYGLYVRTISDDVTIRGVCITGLDVSNNTAGGIRVEERPSGRSPYATSHSRIEGFCSGSVSIDQSVLNDSDFVNDIKTSVELSSLGFGSYTPSGTGVTNISTLTPLSNVRWSRIGNVVTVSGQINVNALAAGATEFTISLPVSSDFTSTRDAAGTVVGLASGSTEVGSVSANITTDTVAIRFVSAGSGLKSYQFLFSYAVL